MPADAAAVAPDCEAAASERARARSDLCRDFMNRLRLELQLAAFELFASVRGVDPPRFRMRRVPDAVARGVDRPEELARHLAGDTAVQPLPHAADHTAGGHVRDVPLHTALLKKDLFPEFDALYPGKFQNK